jgi:hypothetical protein
MTHLIAPSPSGKLVALAFSTRVPSPGPGTLELVDLLAGKRRSIDVAALPISAAWSPSGRELAVSLADGSLHMYEAR